MWKYLFIAGNLYLRGLQSLLSWSQKVFGSIFWGSYGKITDKAIFDKLNVGRSKYDDKEIAADYLRRYRPGEVALGGRERQLLLGVFYALNKLKKDKNTGFVFADLGGGFGTHFDLINKYLPQDDLQTYRIIETASVRESYLQNTALHVDPRKIFHTLEDFPFEMETDIFLAVGSLVYLPDVRVVLLKILACARIVILDFFPLVDGTADIYSRQYARKPVYAKSTSYPIFYMAKQNFESMIKAQNFRIEYSHEEAHTGFYLNFKVVKSYTYVISRI